MDANLKEYYLHCGIRNNWHNKSLSDYSNDEEALSLVTKYLDNLSDFVSKGVGLYLWGSNGTGKSYLMNCAFKELIERGYKVKVLSLDEIVNKFTASWYSDEERQSLNNILQSVTFLGIDEFGKNRNDLPDLIKRVMESVIRFRVQMGKPIWFASNTDPKYVKEIFSEDIASLMREAVIPICVRGEDYRKEIQRRNKALLS